MNTGQVQERARAWADEFATAGPASAAASIRAAVAAAPADTAAILVRALRYLHQILLDADAARALAAHLFREVPPPTIPTPRQAALERERALLDPALAAAAAREPELAAAAAELARLAEEERALETERRELERLLEDAARG